LQGGRNVIERFVIPALLKSQNAEQKSAVSMVRVRAQDGRITALGLIQIPPLAHIQGLLEEQFGVFN
jgi:hypothetical protein